PAGPPAAPYKALRLPAGTTPPMTPSTLWRAPAATALLYNSESPDAAGLWVTLTPLACLPTALSSKTVASPGPRHSTTHAATRRSPRTALRVRAAARDGPPCTPHTGHSTHAAELQEATSHRR